MGLLRFFGRSCSSCKPVKTFFEDEGHAFDFIDVRRSPKGRAEMLAIVRGHAEAAVVRGGKVVRVEPAQQSDDELAALFLGREGNLRAPTVSNGSLLLTGYDEATLRELVDRSA